MQATNKHIHHGIRYAEHADTYIDWCAGILRAKCWECVSLISDEKGQTTRKNYEKFVDVIRL